MRFQHRSRRLPYPSKKQLNQIYTALRARPNVVSCYLGFKYSRGRRLKSLAIVCLVREKIDSTKLTKRSRIPETMHWTDTQNHTHEIPTDVVVVRGRGTLCSPTCGPGDALQATESGSIGMAINHPTLQKVVTTAGHCALQPGEGSKIYDFSAAPRPATLTNIGSGASEPGQVLKAACTSLCDYALVRPADPSQCTNFYRDGTQIAKPLDSDPQIGDPVTLLTCKGDERSATITGVHAHMPIGVGGEMFQLIVTTPTLIPGDSGGLLVTADGHALGIAVGFVPLDEQRVVSVFMPAQLLLDRESADFL